MKKPLPLRVTPIPRETIPSFLSCMAAVNGLGSQDFALDMGLTLRKFIELHPDALQGLAELGDLQPEALEALISWTGRGVGSVRMAFRGEVFVSRALRNPKIR